eukprot:gene2643-4531_t
MMGRACRDVTAHTRFGREKERLYGPDSKFVVTSALSREMAQILGREGIQLFSLRGVCDLEAVAVFARRTVSDAVVDGGGAEMTAQLFAIAEAMQAAAAARGGDAARGAVGRAQEACCDSARPLIRSPLLSALPERLNELGAPPAIAPRALARAAGLLRVAAARRLCTALSRTAAMLLAD